MQQYFDFAKKFITENGDYVLQHWHENVIIGTEDSGNNVSTNFDDEIELKFTEAVKNEFPDHGFKGEEHPELNKDAEFTWYIDPIDGTKWFAKGIPTWCNVITLTQNNQAVLSLVYSPVSKQLYHAIEGQGAFINNKKLEVNKNKELKNSQIAFDFPISEQIVKDYQPINNATWDEFYKSKLQALSQLYYQAYRVRDLGTGPLSICWLANGFFDGYIAPVQHKDKIVDHLGPLLIAREAGAVVEMTPLSADLNYIVAASNQQIFNQLKAIFSY